MGLKTTPFDPAEYLDDDETIANYLTEALKTGDEAFILDAMGVAARAKGMAGIASTTKLSRTSLYRSLSADGDPKFTTILATLDALGLSLEAKVKPAA